MMIQHAPPEKRFAVFTDAIQEIISEVQAWESAEDVRFRQIWLTTGGKYWCTYDTKKTYLRDTRAGETLSCGSHRAPLNNLCEAFSEIAVKAGMIIHHIYRPENLPGFISFRVECNKKLHHFNFQEKSQE